MPLVGVGWDIFHAEAYGIPRPPQSSQERHPSSQMRSAQVSPGYRDEILTPEFGFGLEGVLNEKRDHLTGSLNGVNYNVSKFKRRFLVALITALKIYQIRQCGRPILQKIAGLHFRADVPLMTIVSRLSNQKGIDLLQHKIRVH